MRSLTPGTEERDALKQFTATYQQEAVSQGSHHDDHTELNGDDHEDDSSQGVEERQHERQ